MTNMCDLEALQHSGTHGIEYTTDKDDGDALVQRYELDRLDLHEEFESSLSRIGSSSARVEKIKNCRARLRSAARAERRRGTPPPAKRRKRAHARAARPSLFGREGVVLAFR